jgi:hypothetical protein
MSPAIPSPKEYELVVDA